MATGLGVEPRDLHVALDDAVREQLQDLSDVQPEVRIATIFLLRLGGIERV